MLLRCVFEIHMRYLTMLDVKHGQKQNISLRDKHEKSLAKSIKKSLLSAFDFLPHVSSDSQHADVSYFTLFMDKRNCKVLRFDQINKCTFILT